jgi:hypothetical protein
MSYLTLEVEVDHGRVVAKEPGQLPERGRGLLTALSPLEALNALQQHLGLDEGKATEWMDAVREARR